VDDNRRRTTTDSRGGVKQIMAKIVIVLDSGWNG
jgi:hypothetical protein